MKLTPWVVESPEVTALPHRARYAYIVLAAHSEAQGAPDGTIDDATFRRVRGQYRSTLLEAGLVEPAGDRWRVLSPRVRQEAQQP
ncbi:hypothetical protein [Tsukamurella pseudospumae]|uniref:DUF2087 domain-containing protein n=1 Tax=Tsukamurella pseudospumae TaxID=239498 RepID=A0A137ZRP3_9ACTN|nr:hypothetical protein [Tsukamurella pseudospumae]KXP00873.1 hypothetical protein AXK61_12755 [Tsukamurella pseudospumae]